MTWQNARTPKQAKRAARNANGRVQLIRDYIKAKKMTQKFFADAAGISQTAFGCFMSGRTLSGSIAYTVSMRYMKANPI